MSQDDPIPVMMRLIETNPNTPPSLSTLKDCIFVVKLPRVCGVRYSTDPLIGIDIALPPANQQQSDHPIPTAGAFILTLIGKWNDIAKYNYSALKYTITHLHDHKTNNQAAFDALQEMGCHLNACFTHPIAKQMIIKANGQQLSVFQYTSIITFGLVTNVDKTKNKHPTTVINPCDTTQSIISNEDPTYINTPSVGWLCLFVHYGSSNGYYCYHLPIVNLSQHTQFMTTYNPQDLPPAEATAYNALLDKWQNEKCNKRLSSRIPKPNELNPYIYVEAWNSVIQPIKDAEAKAALEKQRQKEEEEQRQLEQYIKSKSIQQFEEYQRLLLLQQQNDIYNNLYDITIKTDTNNTPRATTNETSFILLLNSNDNCDANGNNTNNNINTNTLPLSSSSLQHTLFNEYYYKQYIKSQLDDLKIMNHLQYYQYLSSSSLSSGTTYRPRPHIALPSSSSSTTSTSTIDTLIDLATSLPPPQSTASALVTYTNNDVTNSTNTMDDMSANNNTNNNTINNTNQPTIIIPHQQTTINNSSRQQLTLLQEQYNNILDQKHILTIQYDDLINKYNNTILQTNETYNKRTATLQQQIQTLQTQITTLEDQLQSSNIKIQTLQTQITTLQDEMITLKDEHENETTTLKEECHRKEIEAKDLLLTAYNKNSTLTSNNNDIPLHIFNQISFLQQQLQSKDTLYQQQIAELTQSKDKQLEAKDKQLETKEAIHQQQITELTQSKDKQIIELTQSKDKQLESTNIMYQQQIAELTQSKDKQLELQHKQLESKDQQIALLMQMLAEANKK